MLQSRHSFSNRFAVMAMGITIRALERTDSRRFQAGACGPIFDCVGAAASQ
jgi:hypothetical protein